MDEAKRILHLARSLYTRNGYFERFFEICQENPGMTYKACYHQLEIEHFDIFSDYRYIDYDSFRKAKARHIKDLCTSKVQE